MGPLRVALIILSFLLLGTHYMHSGNLVMMIISLLFPVLLFIKKKWVINIISVALLAGAIVWIHTAYNIIQVRIENHAPWLRLALIMSGVTGFTIFSAILTKKDKTI